MLTIWRRPKETNEVINALRKVKPKKLFIACDGPRKGNNEEFDKVQKTIAVCKEKINWEPTISLDIGLKKTIDHFKKTLETDFK